ncbi:MAG: DUF2336 domain-containing protein [Proteobacteria bacterium]|nr:DUF2336 domain-containing protein [Pseudomonadota bacterium]
MAEKLSAADIARMMKDTSPESRQKTAEKVAIGYAGGALSVTEREIAEDIFRVMVKDAEERVRAALSKQLMHARDLSPDVALTLANDVSDAVALPILEFSEALSDADLIEIVRTQGDSRQAAIAGREAVSGAVASVLAEEGSEVAVAVLVGNEGADLGEAAMHSVIDRFGESEFVQEPLVRRGTLPIAVSERLVAMVSDKLQDYIVTHHDLSEDVASAMVLQSRERATLGLIGRSADTHDIEALIDQLYRNGRLTPSIILRSICAGDINFFEAALARLSDLPLVNARALIHDEGMLGLKSIYDRSGLSRKMFPAYRVAFDMARENERERSDIDPEAVMRRTLERVLTHFEDMFDDSNHEDMDFLLNKLGHIANAA